MRYGILTIFFLLNLIILECSAQEFMLEHLDESLQCQELVKIQLDNSRIVGTQNETINSRLSEQSEVRHIFIDGGALDGRLYHSFFAVSSYSNYSWEIFAIEANSMFIDTLPQFPNLTITSVR